MKRGAAGHRRGTAAAGAEAHRRAVRVTCNHSDLLEGHADLVRGDLSERRLVALPVRHLRGEHRHHAVGLEADAHLLGAHHPAAAAPFARARGGLDERRHADAEVAAFRACRCLASAERGQVDDLGHPLERLAGGDADEAAARDHRERRLASSDHVAESQLERLDADLVSHDVEHALAGERLGRPRPAVGDVLRLVRHSRVEREAERFHLVGTGKHRLDEPADHGAHPRVRAGVDGHVDLQAEDVAVVRDAASAIMLSSRA